MVRPVVAELQRRFAVSATETGALDLHRRAGIGMAMFGWSNWTRRRAKARRQVIEAAIA